MRLVECIGIAGSNFVDDTSTMPTVVGDNTSTPLMIGLRAAERITGRAAISEKAA